MAKKRRPVKRPGWLGLWAVFGGLIVIIIALLIALNLRGYVTGVRIDSIPVSGLSGQDAQKLLAKKLNALPAMLTFKSSDGTTVNIPRRALPFTLNLPATLKAAYAIGRNSDPMRAIREQILAVFGQIDIPFTINETGTNSMAVFVRSYLAKFEKPVVNGAVSIKNNKLTLTPAASGLLVNQPELTATLQNLLTHRSNNAIPVTLMSVPPTVTTAQALHALTSAQSILNNGPYTMQVQDQNTWTIDKTTLLSWLNFSGQGNSYGVTVDARKINDFLTSVAPSVSHPPVNAVLADKDGKVAVETPDIAGITINITGSTAAFQKNITKGIKTTKATIVTRPATIRADNLKELGLTDVLAKARTNFVGSSASRSHNITVGAARFDGTLIAKGQTFSFDKHLGQVDAEQGYLPELVIKGNETIPEYGGGLCQVSTTLFRAAVYAGLTITERQAHSYVVKYYNPIGFDATIYPPYADLKFKNTTPANIYIQSYVEGTNIYFEIFGTSDGRTVKIVGPTVYDRQPDKSMKAVFTQDVYKADGSVLLKKRFYSNYKSPYLYPVIKNPLE